MAVADATAATAAATSSSQTCISATANTQYSSNFVRRLQDLWFMQRIVLVVQIALHFYNSLVRCFTMRVGQVTTARSESYNFPTTIFVPLREVGVMHAEHTTTFLPFSARGYFERESVAQLQGKLKRDTSCKCSYTTVDQGLIEDTLHFTKKSSGTSE